MEMVQFLGPKIIYAIFVGSLVGLERELRQKSAGIKTNILICVGAMLYSAISLLISEKLLKSGVVGDPGRVMAQIVSGIGFLGGGAIIQGRGIVQGLTTAATIWVVAALGICIGLGYAPLAVGLAVAVVMVLILVNLLEVYLLGKPLLFVFEAWTEVDEKVFEKILSDLLKEFEFKLVDMTWRKKGKNKIVKIRYRGFQESHQDFIVALCDCPEVKKVVTAASLFYESKHKAKTS